MCNPLKEAADLEPDEMDGGGKKLRLPGDLVVAKVGKGFQVIKKVEFLDSFYIL